MAQKLYCPMCNNLLIPNFDLVTDKKVCFDIGKMKTIDKSLISTIKCDTCKRRIRYFIEK